jgi:hypothetical protein
MPRTRKSDRRASAGSVFFDSMRRALPGLTTTTPPAAMPARNRLKHAFTRATVVPSIDPLDRLYEALAALGFPVDRSDYLCTAKALERAARLVRVLAPRAQRRVEGARGGAKSKTGDVRKDISDLAYRLEREFGLKPWPSLLRAINELWRDQPERFLAATARGKPGSAGWIKLVADRVRKWRE